MLRVAAFFYSLIASVLAGMGVVAALVTGQTEALPILAAGFLGALMAVPVSWLVARHLTAEISQTHRPDRP